MGTRTGDGMGYRIERIGTEDWEHLRRVRLAQLLDTPMAFAETHATALAFGEDEWRSRTARVNEPGCIGLVAVDEAGEWVGTMISFASGPGSAVLVGVWVDPGHRGRERGVADRLLDGIVAWARTAAGARRLVLTVHEDNPRATAFYERRGFAFTGASEPYVLDPDSRLAEMVLPLD
ncbi:N-acetyltransferase [Kitasatospora sp. A2-31]|uniref:GNAT family N-acetyltransferase n=1 Tax=Kitasatospora sp. A2-31 TaxID=2916414 RepID=UPI001EEAEA86|nr:GNAT family N-acetyltransferase [Kitasatospora sp. A2-31]MCG6498483.1 GNAT family N-acetyltransferase [Kitasatospora sp. A2-31]